MNEKELIAYYKNKIFLSRGDVFDIDYDTYRFAPEYIDLREKLRKRTFSVGETGVTYRVINHWEHKNLLPERKGDEGWRKFSFAELVWLQVIRRLRNYGISLEIIEKIKRNVMTFDKKVEGYPLFEYFIVKASSSHRDPYVVVLPDGRGDIGFSYEIESRKIENEVTDTILISLKSILIGLGFETKKPETLLPLTEAEIDIIHTLRFANPKKISITQIGDKVRDIDITEQIQKGVKVSDVKRELAEEGAYAELTSGIEEGVQQFIRVTKKKRYK